MPGRTGRARFRVLGPLEVDDGADGTYPLRSAIRRRLLGILLAEPVVDLPADRVVDQLWYEDPPLGRSSLHIQVSRLRKDLQAAGATPITTVATGYRLDVAPAEVDWLAFRELSAAARDLAERDPDQAIERARRALSLWRGAAFEDVLGCPLIDDRARQLDADRRSLTLDLAALLEGAGRHREVVELLDPVWSGERFDEPIALLLARNLHLAGHLERALGVFAETRRSLADELDASPSNALLALEATVRDDPSSVRADGPRTVSAGLAPVPEPALPAPSTSTLIGRRAELALLADAIGAADRPLLVEVLAPSGYGKTTLALQAARAARGRGLTARFGRFVPIPAASGVGVRGAFADLLGGAGQSDLGVGERVTATEIGRTLALAVAEGLDRVGASGPVVVVADDAGEADAVDRRALEELLAVTDRPWFLIVLATTRWPLVGLRSPDHTIELRPFTADELAASLDVGVADAVVQALGELTGGDPLTVSHALGRLRSVALDDRVAALRSFAGDPASGGLRYPQLARCTADATRVLRTLATLDGPVPAAAISRALALDEDAVAACAVELIEAGLAVEERDGALAPSHLILASLVRSSMGAEEVDELREAVFTSAASSERWMVASLLGAGTQVTHHDELVEDLERALRKGAYVDAGRIAEIVLAGHPDPHHAVRALLARAQHLEWAEEADNGREEFAKAYDLAGRLGDDRSLVDAVRGLLGIWSAGSGPSPEQAALVEAALDQVTSPGPRAQLLSRAVALHLGVDPRSRTWAEEALALAQQVGDPQALAMATCAFSKATLGHPGLVRRHQLLARLLRTSSRELGSERLLALLAHHLVASCELGDLEEAADLVQRHHQEAERSGRALHAWRDHVFQASLAMGSGRPTDAAAAIEGAVAIARRHRLPDGRMTELLQRAALAMWTGDDEVPGYRSIARVAPDDLLAHALDAFALAVLEPDLARASLRRVSSGLATMAPTYLRWATVAATGLAAERLGDDAALDAARQAWQAADVAVPVLAVGTALLPTDPLT